MLWALAVVAGLGSWHGGRAQSGDGNDYWPGRENAVPHVSGDERLTGTYKFWKDEEAVRRSRAAGLASRDINFKDFRWLEKSFDGMMTVERGRDLFHQKNSRGESCAGCHGENGAKLVGTYAKLPKYNERLKRVVVGPTQIAVCAKERLGLDWPENTKNNSMMDMYIAWLSDGRTVEIDVTSPGPMREAYEKGRDLFFKRTGHFHFACASCHTPPTTQLFLRGQRPSGYYGDAAHYPLNHFPFSLPGDDLDHVFTLQHQIKSCQTLSRMRQGREGSPSMTAIEVFLKASANGYKMSIPTKQYNMDTGYLAGQ
jgi:sulfur-oxidizing protein SoxA